MLKFNDKVRINGGFYEGLIGAVVATTASYAAGAGITYVSYTVKFDNIEISPVLFDEGYLIKLNP